MSKYCPNCFKCHSYIEEKCSVCETRLKRIVPKEIKFLEKALETLKGFK